MYSHLQAYFFTNNLSIMFLLGRYPFPSYLRMLLLAVTRASFNFRFTVSVPEEERKSQVVHALFSYRTIWEKFICV
jgi:hypothetical protein